MTIVFCESDIPSSITTNVMNAWNMCVCVHTHNIDAENHTKQFLYVCMYGVLRYEVTRRAMYV